VFKHQVGNVHVVLINLIFSSPGSDRWAYGMAQRQSCVRPSTFSENNFSKTSRL